MTEDQPSAPNPEAEWWTTSEVATYLGVRVATITHRMRGQMSAPDHKRSSPFRSICVLYPPIPQCGTMGLSWRAKFNCSTALRHVRRLYKVGALPLYMRSLSA